METTKYKGYTGEYQLYDDGQGAATYFAGEIPSVRKYAQVLFEGETIEELTEDFHAAVDDCISRGYVPKEKLHRIAIPATLYEQLATRAKMSGLSFSRYVSHALASMTL